MKSFIYKKLFKSFFAGMCISVLATQNAYANDPDLEISPSIAYFPLVTLGTTSGAITFTIRNNHPSNALNIWSVALGGNGAGEFAVSSESCTTASPLSPSATCTVDVTYSPTVFGSVMARIVLDTDAPNSAKLVAFLSNDEGDQNQAERRLPPVLFSLTVPETMTSNTNYNLQWSMLGYHKDYISAVAIFDCDGVSAGQCGLNFGDNIASSGLLTAASSNQQPGFTFNGIPATEHHFSYNFQPDLHYSKAPGTYPIVVRFYRKNDMDQLSDEPSLSLMIPGNLSNVYYDDEGRRIQKDVVFP